MTTRKTTSGRRAVRRPVANTESPSNAVEPEEDDVVVNEESEENDENPPEEPEETGEAGEPEDAPDEAVAAQEEALAATGWVTDGYGNPATSSPPTRPLVMGHRFYKFDYVDDDVNEDTIHPTEDVYAVIDYPGSKRRGASLAYSAGMAVPRAILDNIEEDMSGRHGPSEA